MIKIYPISLGCPKNRVDTERTLGFLGNIKIASVPEKADVVFINTCGFIAPAIEESVRTIIEHTTALEDLKNKPLLVVAGCLVGRFGEETLAKDLPEVDVFLDSKNVEDWGNIIAEKAQEHATAKRAGRPKIGTSKRQSLPRMLSTGPSYAWLKISEGCRHACSFLLLLSCLLLFPAFLAITKIKLYFGRLS